MDKTRPNWAIIVAAGLGNRMRGATGDIPKQFLVWRGQPLYLHSADAFIRSGAVAGIVFVFHPDQLERVRVQLDTIWLRDNPGVLWKFAEGGKTRQDSVRNGLEVVPMECGKVFIHDGARPFLRPELINNLNNALDKDWDCVVPAITPTDTIKLLAEDRQSIQETLDRKRLVAVQTPQVFYASSLRKEFAHPQPATDEASLLERAGARVRIIPGDRDNVKITTPDDLKLLEEREYGFYPCVGFGYDVHRFGGQRPLKLGGVLIPGSFTVFAHSDGDVLLHALMDAILGCAGLGDIGRRFPDSDPALDGISSVILLDETLDLARQAGIKLLQADLTVVAQKPRLAPYGEQIRKNIARLLQLPDSRVNFKATTEEGMGFTGALDGIKAYAVASALFKNRTGRPACA